MGAVVSFSNVQSGHVHKKRKESSDVHVFCIFTRSYLLFRVRRVRRPRAKTKQKTRVYDLDIYV